MKKGIIALLSTVIGTMAGGIGVGYLQGKQNNAKLEKINKFKGYYQMLNQWLSLKQEGKTVAYYLEKCGYKDIAIYGMGEMGNRLYEELRGSNIRVKYAVDQTAYFTYPELEILNIDDEFQKVDAIVVTAIFAFEAIEDELSKKVDFPVVSLENIIFQI